MKFPRRISETSNVPHLLIASDILLVKVNLRVHDGLQLSYIFAYLIALTQVYRCSTRSFVF